VEEVIAAVAKAFLAALGGDETSEGGEAGSKEDGELDHLASGIASLLVFQGVES
jgi:hypothetical protein